ncbi:MAG: hypothetical protein ABI554_15055, partial [Flavobacterium sp.]
SSLVANGKELPIIRYADAISFKKVLEAKSAQWRNRKSGTQTVLVLHACKTGQNKVDANGNVVKSFAAKISQSKEFKNVIVIAPDEEIVFRGTKGEAGSGYEIGPRKLEKDEKGNDKIVGMGHWNVFKNGELIEQHDGDWHPADYKPPVDSSPPPIKKPRKKN